MYITFYFLFWLLLFPNVERSENGTEQFDIRDDYIEAIYEFTNDSVSINDLPIPEFLRERLEGTD